MGYIYLIVERDNIEGNKNPVKIGVTTGSIEKRIKKLQTGNNSELHLISSFKTNYPFKLEKMLHLHYHRYRGNGEWFNLTDEEVLNFKNVCEEKENVIQILKKDNYYFNNY